MRALAGWGRYPVAECRIERPPTRAALAALLAAAPSSIARGNGRAYGDAALNPAATFDTRALDRLVELDLTAGMITCEAGLLLGDLLTLIIPRGWFVPVTPGTRLVTIGGMIASDVHGKNHHGVGSFADHVEWLELDCGDGAPRRCSRRENRALFAATCGGMGLTGTIVRARFRLLGIESAAIRQRTRRAPDLATAMAIFDEEQGATYSVAWIDGRAQGAALGRSVVFLGEHARIDELPAERRSAPLARGRPRPRRVPFDLPGAALNPLVVRAFNQAYYAAHGAGERLVGLDAYFYPLDALADWNRIYGRRGFVQYQAVIPLGAARDGLTGLLTAIAERGSPSFLAVLKRMGPASFGMLSFPLEGYTLALDFPVSPESLALLDRLDAITVAHGGRIYLAKDARARPATVAAGYPRLGEFLAQRRGHALDRRFASLLSRRLGL